MISFAMRIFCDLRQKQFNDRYEIKLIIQIIISSILFYYIAIVF